MTASTAEAASPPHPTPPTLVTAIGTAPEDVEQAVGRRRKAHALAPWGAGAGGWQRCPGVGRRAEAVQVVETLSCAGGEECAHVRIHAKGRGRWAAAGAVSKKMKQASGLGSGVPIV